MPDSDKVIKGLQCIIDGTVRCESCGYSIDKHGHHSCQQECAKDAIAILKEQEPEAKWIYGEDETGVDGWRCSECNFFEPWFYKFTEDIDFIRFYRYCPSCGRKMTSYTGKPTQTGG